MRHPHNLKCAGLAPLAGALCFLGGASPALAQGEDYRQIVTIMRACAQIEDIAARVACYDNNIQPPEQGADALPSTSPAPAASTADVDQTTGPATPLAAQGFGAEMVRQRSDGDQQRGEELHARVSSVARTEPGIYLLTLEDGAQWRFVDAAPLSYDPPRQGSQIELERGSLGSAFLTYAGQRRLRVRRVK